MVIIISRITLSCRHHPPIPHPQAKVCRNARLTGAARQHPL